MTAKPQEGNKAPEGFDKRIYTYGHRNPQGIAFRPGTNQPVTAKNLVLGTRMKSQALVNGGNAGWDPRPISPAAATAPTTIAVTCRTRWKAWTPKERSKFMSMTDTKAYPDAMKSAWNNNQLSPRHLLRRIS